MLKPAWCPDPLRLSEQSLMVRSLSASSLKAVIVSLHQFISYANAGIQLKELLALPPSLIL